MIGNGYWATGITVAWSRWPNGWIASVEFFDDGFTEQGSTQGKLSTRYWSHDPGEETLARQIDLVKADAERLGIRFVATGADKPSLYYQGDGEDPEWPAPEGWRELLGRQAARLGWRGPHIELAEPPDPDYGGAFDGFTVSSDADPGL